MLLRRHYKTLLQFHWSERRRNLRFCSEGNGVNHAWGEDRILSFLHEGRQLLKAYSDDSIPFPAPRFISCWISEVCNLDCTYCYFSETNHDKSHVWIDTDKFIDWLGQARYAGAESLEFSGGGEPTLHPDFERIFKAAYYSLEFKLGIITHACNPMPLEEIVKCFKYVRCGLDAATSETHDLIKRNKKKNYWLHKAIENIKEFVRLRDLKAGNDFTVGIKVVLNTINMHEFEDMIRMAVDLKVDYIQFKQEHSSDHPLKSNDSERIELRLRSQEFLREWPFTDILGTMNHARATTKCFMSPIHTVVTATGKILQCCFFEDRPIGTIFQPFKEVWGSPAHREVMRQTTVQECDKVDCRWNYFNRKMKEVIEDPLAQSSFI
jgi:MoaA/NifB/PqqE/SkfB family radical SAM enzyme